MSAWSLNAANFGLVSGIPITDAWGIRGIENKRSEHPMTSQLAVFIDFENVALWAEREFFDFELTPLMEYLQGRGPAVVKRAYGDWSRFSRYRDELMNHSIDLIQIFSVRAGKNRTDIRMAIDAMEVAMHRPQIDTFVIVSGDSDFGPLVAKLREYGRYTLGIGPRTVTHHLLVKSCDEFVYLETVMGETIITGEHTSLELDAARNLRRKALQVHGQRGDIPVLATRLKHTMLLMDPAFNEANFGYSQFKSWLEDSRDQIKLFLKELQLYVAPLDYQAAGYNEVGSNGAGAGLVEKLVSKSTNLEEQYRQLFGRLRLTAVDLETRRDVLRDVYREVSEHPFEYSVDELLEALNERYEEQGLMRSKANLREIIQMAYRQDAFDFGSQNPSQFTPVTLAKGIESEAEFISWAEEDFIYALVRAGLEIDIDELSNLMVNDRAQADYVQCLLDDLHARGMITRRGKHFVIAAPSTIPFRDDPALQVLMDDLERVEVPEGMLETSEMARSLAKKAMLQRSQDFVAATQSSLLACHLQWMAVEKGEPGATMEDLRYYLASYASVVAGKLSQVNRDYAAARPYYLAFFALVQEEDPLWSRMRGLINPMLSYFWVNTGRELELNTSTWNLNGASPAQVAVYIANHHNAELRDLWSEITTELARVNSTLLRRIANQIDLSRGEGPENTRTAQQLYGIIASVSAA